MKVSGDDDGTEFLIIAIIIGDKNIRDLIRLMSIIMAGQHNISFIMYTCKRLTKVVSVTKKTIHLREGEDIFSG